MTAYNPPGRRAAAGVAAAAVDRRMVPPSRHARDLADRVWGGYARISEDPNDERVGVTRQVTDIADGITAHGGQPPTPESPYMWVENDTSAYKKRLVTITDHYGEKRDAWRVVRPMWAEALRALRNGEISALMVYDLDRLARDPYDLEDAIEVVERYGAVIMSATASEIDLNTESGRMAARFLVTMANKSSADTSRRVARAALDAAHQGKPAGGTRPFGWGRSDKPWKEHTADEKAAVNPTEAALIRKAADDLLAGVPLLRITRDWQESGVPTVRGKSNGWRRATLRNMLRNPRMVGWRVHQGRTLLDDNGNPVRGQWEPMLDPDTWDRLQLVLYPEDKRSRISRKSARFYLLTGLLRCGLCNSLMYGNARKDRHGTTRHYYTCQGDSNEFRHTLTINGIKTDAVVERLMVGRLAREDFEKPAAEFTGSARLAEVKAKIAELMEAFDAGTLSGAVVFPRVSKYEEERDRLQAERESFLAATVGPDTSKVTPERWAEMETDERRLHLEDVLDAVYAKPGIQGSKKFDVNRVVPVWKDDADSPADHRPVGDDAA